MKIKAYITTELFGRDGKLKQRRRQRSKSFVEAFLSIILEQMNPAGAVANLTDTGGTERTLVNHAENLRSDAAITVDTKGIVVGKGTTAIAVTDYALADKIADGSGSGQLLYQAQTFSERSVSDPNVSFTIQRDFLNSSGATITVYEIGLESYGRDATAYRAFLTIRDLITGGQAVADGENLRVTYTLQSST